MKLKYYMRGVGTGIVFTVLIFLVIILPHERADKEAEVRAEYEQVQDDTHSGLSQLLSPTGSSDEAEPSEVAKPEVTETPSDENVTPEITDTPETTDIPEEGNGTETEIPVITDEPQNTEDKTSEIAEDASDTEEPSEETSDAPDTSEEPEDSEAGEAEYIIIGISRGMTSEQFAEKAENIGLVDDAAEFNRFIITNGYADDISVGNFSIRKGASFREIAKIVTDASNSIG